MIKLCHLLGLSLLFRTANAGTLKIFVLAGQSNMEGHAEVASINTTSGRVKNGTLLYQLSDPRTADEFAPLWDNAAKNWTVLDNVKVWTNEAGGGPHSPPFQGVNGSTLPGVDRVDAHFGSLTPGYGCDDGNGGAQANLIGPEYGFGFGMQDAASALKGDTILIFKTAWGGKTLAGDYRPPSSGTATRWCSGECPRTVGHFYKTMVGDVAKLMEPGVIGKMFPSLAGLTPEVSGFGWHQGWNDGCSLNQTAEYETNMVNLIKDLRTEWKNPNLAVSIAVSGFDGFDGEEASRTPKGCWDNDATKVDCNCNNDRGCRRLDVVLSQFGAAEPSRHPELNGHVSAMETRGYLRTTATNPAPAQGYHWGHNAETYYLIGKAMASGMLAALGESALPGFPIGQSQPGDEGTFGCAPAHLCP